jgi:putative ABC transport system permease protein
MSSLWQNLRFSSRMLGKNPGFTAVAVLTLAFGIGANTAIFSVVYGALLAPLPMPHPEQLVMVWSDHAGRNVVSPGDFSDWKQQNSVFQKLVAWDEATFSLSIDGHPQTLQARVMSPGFLDMQGIPLSKGRDFFDEEEDPGKEHVVILTNRLWRERFGSDRAILGRKVRLNAETYVVGRAMRSVLYQLSAIDFASVGAVAVVLLVAALLACYLPARRATRIDPMVALRCE